MKSDTCGLNAVLRASARRLPVFVGGLALLKPQARIFIELGHNDKERISERILLDPKDPGALVDEMTVTDPKSLEKPWLNVLKYKGHRDWDLIEDVCTENDLNPVGADGKGVFGMPPAGK